MLLIPSANKDSVARSLILAGGGMRVAYQAGVLQALEEEGLSFQHVDGTSGGTMNAAMLFSDLSPREIGERWRSLKLSGFVSFLPFKSYLNPFKLKAFGGAEGIVKKVFPHLGINVQTINQNRSAEATFNVCNFSKKQNLALSHRQVTLPHLIAGISLPMFMPAVEIDGDWYSDSVWIKDANLIEAVKRGAEEIWLVWCIGNSPEYKDGSFLQYVHMIEMSANGTLLEEFQRILELNQRIAKGDSPYGQKNPITIHVIKPHFPLPLDPAFYLGSIDAHELINIGYHNAKEYLAGRQAAGVVLDWQATAMREPKAVIVSRQVYNAESKNYKQRLCLRLRAETCLVDGAGVAALYGDISLAGVTVNQSLQQGSFSRGTFAAPLSFNGAFVVEQIEWQLKGVISSAPLWQFLLGRGARLKLQIYKANTLFDEADCALNLWRFAALLYQNWKARRQ
ncbi:MAG TPA: patatin-like phospholipase family protein [Cellvibrio sp.]|nr:patatin-like phospholipase family protein [Cellvibrio sp.]